MQPAPLDPHSVQTRHAHRRHSPQATINRQRERIQRCQRVRPRCDIVQTQLHAREAHGHAATEEAADGAEHPESGAVVGTQQLVQHRVARHHHGPDHAAAAQHGAGARAVLQVGKAQEHPEGLTGAGEGEGQGDQFGREAEAA